ncbi:ATP synthase subunit b' [Roseovarius litorisediminis]|uniref:ATP synthase subunit b n=1 Tax=Roseovarius litorisediminis TaxID=1312363 RepID=A0A1Y5RZ97_9RHOB|nr:F0F1 ATP synthase subunit B' [Roseovarius litorisediminis]SLN28411.1 ATP synthase subunit b' [Roseovarius litorisediminis]
MASETHEATEIAADAAHGAADAAHGGAEAVGMPQLDLTTFSNQIFWLAVTLVVIYFVLSRIALPRIAAVLAERQGTITNDLAAAEDLKAKAVEAEEAYNKALADARAEAQNIIAQAKADMKADLDDAIAKADAEIGAKAAEGEKKIAEIRANAMESVKVVAKDTAKEIIAAMGGKADAKTVTAAITARMKG